MKILLFVLPALSFLAAVLILATAQSAIQEIEGFVLFVCSAVLLAGSAIVEAVNQLRDTIGVTTKPKVPG